MTKTHTGSPGSSNSLVDDEAVFARMIHLVHERMLAELAEMDTEKQKGTGTSESRIKSLAAFFKALQGVEEMVNRVDMKREEQSLEGADIVEFRRQLERQIQSVIDGQSEEQVS